MSKALSSLSIQLMARDWRAIEKGEEGLAKKKKRLKERVLRAIEQWGSIVMNAKNMRVLTGLDLQLQATYPVETNIRNDSVRRLLTQIPRGLGRRLFVRSEKFTLRPGADALAVERLRTSAQMTLFALAVQRTPGSPRVKVVKVKKAKRTKRAA